MYKRSSLENRALSFRTALYLIILIAPFWLSTFCYTRNKMQPFKFNYSTKDIPIPSHPAYMKKMIEKAGSLINRMRWKAFFFLRDDEPNNRQRKETYGFKSSRPTPSIPELKSFENGLYDMISNIKTNPIKCPFQDKLRKESSLFSPILSTCQIIQVTSGSILQ